MSAGGSIKVKGREIFLGIDNEIYHFDSASTPLGSGAMGTVYLGRNVRDNHDLVAIKHLNPTYAAIESIRQRARLEASLAFRHRNLIEMIGYCEEPVPNGHMFTVSRLVQGVTIDQYVKRNFSRHKDRVTKIIKLILPILDALDYIHSKGIIHLDIKPSNMMVENGSNIRLMDLGIAYTHDMPGITASGLLGTPGYAAPEQYVESGARELQFTPGTDIYQVGATLYELIGGEKPYENGGTKLKSLPGTSKAVMKVISKALEKSQDDRYSSAIQFSKALREVMHNKFTIWEKVFKK